MESGVLVPGARLPPQRELAYRLGLSLGTVTRAYAEAEREGLLVGEVGRGSFVASRQPADDVEATAVADLSRNLPPPGPVERVFAATFARLAKRRDLFDQLSYAPAGGFEGQRRAGALWLQRTAGWSELDWRRLVYCAGAQQGIAVALAALCRHGDAVIAEAATFHGLKTLASHAGYRLVPAAMDGEGITPEALDRAAESGARVAYLLPLQNPTAAVMGQQRRRDLVEVARRRDVTIVEDDLYAAYAAELGVTPLAELAPERVWHVSGLSKCLSPGLRVGFLVPPAAAMERALEALRAMTFGPPNFGPFIAGQWIEDGEAFRMLAAVRAELAMRTALARQVLGSALAPTPISAAPHLWLPMSELEAERAAGRSLRAGVRVTPPGAPTLPGGEVSGLRICLGPVRERDRFEAALRTVKSALGPALEETQDVV